MTAVATAVRQRRTQDLVARLALDDHLAQTVVFERKGNTNVRQLQQLAQDALRGVTLSDRWAKVVAHHLACLQGLQRGEQEVLLPDYQHLDFSAL